MQLLYYTVYSYYTILCTATILYCVQLLYYTVYSYYTILYTATILCTAIYYTPYSYYLLQLLYCIIILHGDKIMHLIKIMHHSWHTPSNRHSLIFARILLYIIHNRLCHDNESIHMTWWFCHLTGINVCTRNALIILCTNELKITDTKSLLKYARRMQHVY